MENFRAGAIMIFCGVAKGGEPEGSAGSSAFSKLVQKLTAPLAYGATDVDLITGTETSPNITQSETFTTANPDNPDQIVVAFNDSRGVNADPLDISGGISLHAMVASLSRVSPTPTVKVLFANTFGDPVVLYNKATGTWFTVWISMATWAAASAGISPPTPSDPNSWTHYSCVHNWRSGDDRESGWADNNPSSPFFGRMYISWNDFNVGQRRTSGRYSLH